MTRKYVIIMIDANHYEEAVELIRQNTLNIVDTIYILEYRLYKIRLYCTLDEALKAFDISQACCGTLLKGE